MKNKLGVLSLLLFLLFALCGCSDINFSREYNSETGEIIDTLTLSLNSDKLSKETLNALDASIKEDFNNYILRIGLIEGVNIHTEIIDYNYKLRTSFKNIQLLLTIYNNNDIGPFAFFITHEKQAWASSYTPFLYKYKPDINKSILASLNYRLSINDSKTYYHRYYEMLTGEEPTENLMLDEINITQSFTTDIDRLYSNANSVVIKDGKITHTWNLNDKDANFELQIYKLMARSSSWYIMALVLTLILLIALIIIIKIKGNKPITLNEFLENNQQNSKDLS